MILYLDSGEALRGRGPQPRGVRTAAKLAGTCATSRIAYVEFLYSGDAAAVAFASTHGAGKIKYLYCYVED